MAAPESLVYEARHVEDGRSMSCHLGAKVRSPEKRKAAHLKVGLLAPLAVLTKLPAVVTQEHHNGGFSQTKVCQNTKHPVELKMSRKMTLAYLPISWSAWDTEA